MVSIFLKCLVNMEKLQVFEFVRLKENNNSKRNINCRLIFYINEAN